MTCKQMKRGRMLLFLLGIILVLNFSLVFAALENVSDVSTKGYACLESKIEDKCSSLSAEEKIFSLLSVGQCKDEVLSDALNGECWPKSGCRLRTTALAMLALKENGINVTKSIDWLLSKKMAPTGVDFLLQIEPLSLSKCAISYLGGSHNIIISEDKKINADAGYCLSLYGDNYWLKIKNTCYDKEFQISCNVSFTTNIIYKDEASSTIYVSEGLSSAPANTPTTESVNYFCLKQGTTCDYEGNLWAAIVLNGFGYDSSVYVPYLVVKQSANEKYVPEAFLYALLGDSYRNDILVRQRENKYWLESGDRFYDTAVALYPFQYEELSEKTSTISWLEETQGSNGCWQDNLRNTAFLLYSIWPKRISPKPIEQDCESAGHFCLSKANCESVDGQELSFSGCFGATTVCCSKEKPLEQCDNQNGIICGSDEICTGDTIDASDLSSGQRCCIDGDCEVPTPAPSEEEKTQCETYGGICRNTCSGSETESSHSCNGSQNCCISATAKKANYLLIIIFSVLILLVVLGILFRKKLRELILRFKLKGKGKPSSMRFPPRGFPPSSTSAIQPRMMPRRFLPSQPANITYKPTYNVPVKKPEEVDEVLKRLKEIGSESSARTPSRPREETAQEKKEVYVRSHVRRVNKSKK